MKLIVGLGNPGKKYENTRHNIGFLVIEALCSAWPECSPLKENKTLKSKISISRSMIIAEPLTFMNQSGQAIQSISDYYKIDWEDPKNSFIEIRDDLDIPFGQMKIQKGHGPAGHKGAISTMDFINPNIIWQFRVGIAGTTKNQIPGEAYVLSHFNKDEQAKLPDIINRAVEALKISISHGPDVAAQQYNQKNLKQ